MYLYLALFWILADAFLLDESRWQPKNMLCSEKDSKMKLPMKSVDHIMVVRKKWFKRTCEYKACLPLHTTLTMEGRKEIKPLANKEKPKKST